MSVASEPLHAWIYSTVWRVYGECRLTLLYASLLFALYPLCNDTKMTNFVP